MNIKKVFLSLSILHISNNLLSLTTIVPIARHEGIYKILVQVVNEDNRDVSCWFFLASLPQDVGLSGFTILFSERKKLITLMTERIISSRIENFHLKFEPRNVLQLKEPSNPTWMLPILDLLGLPSLASYLIKIPYFDVPQNSTKQQLRWITQTETGICGGMWEETVGKDWGSIKPILDELYDQDAYQAYIRTKK